MPTTDRVAAGPRETVAPILAQRRQCPICDGTRVDELHTQQLVLPAEFNLPETFDVLTCSACGMVYSDTTRESERLTAHYRAESYAMYNWEDHRPDSAARRTLGPPVDIARLRVVVEELRTLLPVRDVRVLDVGCASGRLLALLTDAGFTDVQGIDPSATAVMSARELGQRARVADLDSPLPADLGTFDVVIISHVLEHLGRPREALTNLRRVLRPGAIIYAEVPDAARYAEFLVEPFIDFNHEHVNHFSHDHLNEIFRASGFVRTTFGEKTITVVDWPYPVIYGIWRVLDALPDRVVSPAFDTDRLREQLMPYISGSHDLLARYNATLAAQLLGRRQIAVRCLGYRAWTLLGSTLLRDLDIVAYIDNAPEKQTLTVRGIRVTDPREPLATGIPIVVLAYHVEAAVVEEYAHADPGREVIIVGRSRPVSCQ